MKFDDPVAGNSMKTYGGELKELVPITAVTMVFPYSYNNRTVIDEQRQYPLVLAYVITIHRSQGSTLDYTIGDLDCTTDKGPCPAVINKGQFYTLLLRIKSLDKVRLLNFGLSHLCCNEHALAEMERMKNKSNNYLFD